MIKINQQNWGRYAGRDVYLLELDNERGMRAVVSNFGALLKSLWVKDINGEEIDVVLGYDSLEEYVRSDTFFGAMVGPIADRLENGCFEADGRRIQLPVNAGPDCMHSSSEGFHTKIWDWIALEDGIAFSYTYENGIFPGKMKVCLRYRLMDSAVLRIEYHAECDRETAVSFTNHSYFNLDGGLNHCRGHKLRVNADRYAETRRERDPICTGRELPVDATPLDLRSGACIADVLAHGDFPEIRTGGGVDHYLIVNGIGMREHACLESAKSGLRMFCRSDAPGVLVYTANGLECEKGKLGAVYGKNWAVCLETQRFPNAVNNDRLRDRVILRPNEAFESATEFDFGLL